MGNQRDLNNSVSRTSRGVFGSLVDTDKQNVKDISAFIPSTPECQRSRMYVKNKQPLSMVQDCGESDSHTLTIQDHQCLMQGMRDEQKDNRCNYTIKSLEQNLPLQDCREDIATSSTALKGKNIIDTQHLQPNQISVGHECESDKQNSTKQILERNSKSPTESDETHDMTSSRMSGENLSDRNVFNLSTLFNSLDEKCQESKMTESYEESSDTAQHHSSSPDSEKSGKGTSLRNYIDQASKWGFSDQQIMNVLRRLEANSNMDDMMKELMKEAQEADENVEIESDELFLTSQEQENDDDREFDVNDSSNLRKIVIDGSNVAMNHGQKVFSCKGIKIVVDWFKKRGHKDITVFVPQWRKEASRPDAPIADQEILSELEAERVLVFTPSRRVGGTRIVCYDDRYVLQLASQTDGIIVSNDVYRDLVRENDDFRQVVEKRLLMYSFVKDTFMPPEDPLGRLGPSLDNFLRIKPFEPKHQPMNCPYGKKCTYGVKCKFYHPERKFGSPPKMVAEKIKESVEVRLKGSSNSSGKQTEVATEKGRRSSKKLFRTVSLLPQVVESTSQVSERSERDGKTRKPQLQHSLSLGYPNSYLSDFRRKMELAELQAFTSTITTQPSSAVADALLVSASDPKSSPQLESNSCHYSTSGLPTSVGQNFQSGESVTFASAQNLNPPHYKSAVILVNAPLPVMRDTEISENENNNTKERSSQNASQTHGALPHSVTSPSSDKSRTTSTDSATNLVWTKPPPISTKMQNEEESLEAEEIYLPPELPKQNYIKKNIKDVEIYPFSPVSLPASKDDSSNYHELSNDMLKEIENCSPPSPMLESKNDTRIPRVFHRSVSSSGLANVRKSPNYQPHQDVSRKWSLNNNTPDINTSNAFANHQSGQAVLYQCVPAGSQPPTPTYQTTQSLYGGTSRYDSGYISEMSNDPNAVLVSATDNPNRSSPMSNSSIFGRDTNNTSTFSTHLYPQYPIQSQNTMLHPSGYHPHTYTAHDMSNSYHTPPTSPWAWQNRMPFDTGLFQDNQGLKSMANAQVVPPKIHPRPNPQIYDRTGFRGAQVASSQYSPLFPPDYSTTHPLNYGNSGLEFVYETNPPTSTFQQVPPPPLNPGMAKVIDDEAPISVDDPRYSVYYHLSSVFGERVVRTFMNRNPDTLMYNFQEIYNLILVYKQNMGV